MGKARDDAKAAFEVLLAISKDMKASGDEETGNEVYEAAAKLLSAFLEYRAFIKVMDDPSFPARLRKETLEEMRS